MKMKSIYSVARLAILTITVIIHSISYAQGFKVKDFKQALNDGSAFHAPLDDEEHPCGLIKVRSDNSELQFKGNIVGDVDNKMNEYWVYVPHSCRQLIINHPNFMPFFVSFADYGVEVSSKATYILTLEETKYKKEKNGMTIIVKPGNAALYIDDTLIEDLSGNGYYQLYLPKGEHVCKLSKNGYRPFVQVVQTGKTSQIIDVELESVMAELEIKCKTTTAEIYIDGELKGNGTWKGEIASGNHMIEARQQNYNSHTQTITLVEKEVRAFSIPELQRSTGKLKIETIPNEVPITFDGKDVGLSPYEIECETGTHHLTINAFGCIPYRIDVEMVGDKVQKKTIELKYIQDDYYTNLYRKAYQGDIDAIEELADHFVRGHGGADKETEAIFWAERHPNTKDFIARYDKYYWINAYSDAGMPEKGLTIAELNGGGAEEYDRIGKGFQKKGLYDKAIECYQNAINLDKYELGYGLEGMGDCYKAKGNNQFAENYYRKCLSLDYYDGMSRVKKKLKDLRQ